MVEATERGKTLVAAQVRARFPGGADSSSIFLMEPNMNTVSIPKRFLERFNYDEQRDEHYALSWVGDAARTPGNTQRTYIRFRVEFRPEGYAVLFPNRGSK